ncbi:MAG TPA: glycosyltransferase family 1 protein [Bacteroidetes bacterium]|nr:glycosyltransferase family 1 protein [Bacteroidota bacterium]
MIRRFVKKHPEHEFIFLFDRPYDSSFVFADNIKPIVVSPQARHPFLWYWWFEKSLPKVLKREMADCFISTDGFLSSKLKIPQLLVIHDLALEHYPENVSWMVNQYYKLFSKKYALKADRIITVSDYSKQDIHELYGVELSKIDTVYNGANELYVPLNDTDKNDARTKYSAGEPYFIYVGAVHPRKNVITLLKAFEQFKESTGKSHKLLIVGRMAWKNEDLKTYYSGMKFKQDVILTGSKQAKELSLLIASAEAMIYLSYFEGFGIPVLESIYCEVPVIISDRTSLPEVAGEGGIIIDPFDVQAAAQAMDKIITDKENTRQLVEKGKAQKEKFSWEKSANRFDRSFQEFCIDNKLT